MSSKEVVMTATAMLEICRRKDLSCEENRRLRRQEARILDAKKGSRPEALLFHGVKRTARPQPDVDYLLRAAQVLSKLAIRLSIHLKNLQSSPSVGHAGSQGSIRNQNNVQRVNSKRSKSTGLHCWSAKAQTPVISSRSKPSGMFCRSIRKWQAVCLRSPMDL